MGRSSATPDPVSRNMCCRRHWPPRPCTSSKQRIFGNGGVPCRQPWRSCSEMDRRWAATVSLAGLSSTTPPRRLRHSEIVRILQTDLPTRHNREAKQLTSSTPWKRLRKGHNEAELDRYPNPTMNRYAQTSIDIIFSHRIFRVASYCPRRGDP